MARYRRVEVPIFTVPKQKKHVKVMTGGEFKIMRENWKLSQDGIGKALGGYTWRTVAAWESGQNALPPAVNKLMTLFLYNPKFIKNVTRN